MATTQAHPPKKMPSSKLTQPPTHSPATSVPKPRPVEGYARTNRQTRQLTYNVLHGICFDSSVDCELKVPNPNPLSLIHLTAHKPRDGAADKPLPPGSEAPPPTCEGEWSCHCHSPQARLRATWMAAEIFSPFCAIHCNASAKGGRTRKEKAGMASCTISNSCSRHQLQDLLRSVYLNFLCILRARVNATSETAPMRDFARTSRSNFRTSGLDLS